MSMVHKAIEVSALTAKRRTFFDTVEQDWIVSPKYDGCHVVFLFDYGEVKYIMSRAGEHVKSMSHVAAALSALPGLPQGRFAICGEAWSPTLEFNQISGKFRQHQNAPELRIAPFDMVPWEYNTETTSGPPVLLGDPTFLSVDYRDRLNGLRSLLREAGPEVVWPVHHSFRGTLAEAIKEFTPLAQELKSYGVYDGCILALARGDYIPGSGKDGEFIKLKPTISYTVTVTGAALDFGTKTGKNTAALKFMLDGKEQKVSTGLTQAQVDEITAVGWDGYRIEVGAMGKTINGYLREPRFLGIRYDA